MVGRVSGVRSDGRVGGCRRVYTLDQVYLFVSDPLLSYGVCRRPESPTEYLSLLWTVEVGSPVSVLLSRTPFTCVHSESGGSPGSTGSQSGGVDVVNYRVGLV